MKGFITGIIVIAALLLSVVGASANEQAQGSKQSRDDSLVCFADSRPIMASHAGGEVSLSFDSFKKALSEQGSKQECRQEGENKKAAYTNSPGAALSHIIQDISR